MILIKPPLIWGRFCLLECPSFVSQNFSECCPSCAQKTIPIFQFSGPLHRPPPLALLPQRAHGSPGYHHRRRGHCVEYNSECKKGTNKLGHSSTSFLYISGQWIFFFWWHYFLDAFRFARHIGPVPNHSQEKKRN